MCVLLVACMQKCRFQVLKQVESVGWTEDQHNAKCVIAWTVLEAHVEKERTRRRKGKKLIKERLRFEFQKVVSASNK